MRLLAFFLLLAILPALIPRAVAQDSGDITVLSDRVNRLEHDLDALEQQVYRRGNATAATPTEEPASGPEVLQTQDRLARLEDKMRDLTGKIQVINNAIDQLNQRLDNLSNDVNTRFGALEHGGATSTVIGPTAAAAAPAVNASTAAGGASGASGTPVTNESTINGTTPREEYRNAFALLRRADYADAEEALRAFIKQHPKDPLAGNAQYWLGETYYVRRNWKDAAIAFAEGYQKYPKNSKAPYVLLRLAMSLDNMGEKASACTALRRLERDYTQMPANVRGRASSEKQRLGC